MKMLKAFRFVGQVDARKALAAVLCHNRFRFPRQQRLPFPRHQHPLNLATDLAIVQTLWRPMQPFMDQVFLPMPLLFLVEA